MIYSLKTLAGENPAFNNKNIKTMEKYEITKDQILELDKFAVQGCDNVIRDRLKSFFPDAFKKELELNKWYIPETEKGSLWFIKYVLGNGKGYGYGFIKGNYKECQTILINDSLFQWREATDEEVEKALRSEAKRRGYKKGVSCIFGKAEDKRRLETDDFILSTDNELCVKRFNSQTSDIIFKDGKWSEIIPEETKIITIDKAVKILSKKYGKQVDIK